MTASDPWHVFSDIVAASIAGSAGIATGQPLDAVKVRLQTTHGVYKGPIDCFRGIVARDGVLALYRGMLAPILSNAPINAIVFAVENAVLRELRTWERTRIWDKGSQHLFAGAVSGLAQTPIVSMAELVKIRLQVAEGASLGAWGMFRHILRDEGVRGLFRGMGWTAIRDAPAFASYFFVYDFVKAQLARHVPILCKTPPKRTTSKTNTDDMDNEDDDDDVPSPWSRRRRVNDWGVVEFDEWEGAPGTTGGVARAARWRQDRNETKKTSTPPSKQQSSDESDAVEDKVGMIGQMIAGAIAGSASWGFLHPIDVTKTIVQSTAGNERTIHLLKSRIARGGYSIFLNGIQASVLRAAPVNAVVFVVYEALQPIILSL